MLGVVVDGPGRPRRDNVVGVITKEHIADEVASTRESRPSGSRNLHR
jgi:hypothetical protein